MDSDSMEPKKTITDMSEDEYYDYLKTIPEHVSWQVRDAWLAVPPCTYNIPYCHADCPYAYECYPDDDQDWDEEYNDRCALLDEVSC